jgi:hypothetical protein
MLHGAFQSMHHDHFFHRLSPSKTEMIDVFVFSAPFGVIGQITELIILKRYMQALLHERDMVLRQIAESDEWRDYLPQA